ncbi:cob(I)yrinic acid a,c-diamide adenosyltransferase [candidate division WOR-3 bacterium]|nr:cob(I)yrinic acid a,c-diamide adenosyltransferase [candidate division WOR-3 bacterium]
MSRQNKGLFQIYTGNGKGKTTAAIGLAVRAAGAGFKVYIGHFLKGLRYSEHSSLEKFSGQIFFDLYGGKDFIDLTSPSEADFERAENGLYMAEENLFRGGFDLVILDEINIAAHFGLIEMKRAVGLIENKPENTELLFTGRYAPGEFIEKAHLVTVMEEVKHYFRDGVEARTGIEM